jgi:hypothetical protein
MKFKLKAYTIQSYDCEIEAENEEKAKDKFMEEGEKGNLESEEIQVLFNDKDGYEAIDSVFSEE